MEKANNHTLEKEPFHCPVQNDHTQQYLWYFCADIKRTIMTQDTSTYYVWIGGSCDYGHKERAGGAAVVIEHNSNIISRDVISDKCQGRFPVIKVKVIKVIKDFRLFKMSPKLSLNAPLD